MLRLSIWGTPQNWVDSLSGSALVNNTPEAGHSVVKTKAGNMAVRSDNDDGTVTFVLDDPYVDPKTGETKLSELTFKARPEVSDLMASDNIKGNFATSVAIISTLTGVLPALIKRVAVKDFKLLAAFVGELVGEDESPETGEP